MSAALTGGSCRPHEEPNTARGVNHLLENKKQGNKVTSGPVLGHSAVGADWATRALECLGDVSHPTYRGLRCNRSPLFPGTFGVGWRAWPASASHRHAGSRTAWEKARIHQRLNQSRQQDCDEPVPASERGNPLSAQARPGDHRASALYTASPHRRSRACYRMMGARSDFSTSHPGGFFQVYKA